MFVSVFTLFQSISAGRFGLVYSKGLSYNAMNKSTVSSIVSCSFFAIDSAYL